MKMDYSCFQSCNTLVFRSPRYLRHRSQQRGGKGNDRVHFNENLTRVKVEQEDNSSNIFTYVNLLSCDNCVTQYSDISLTVVSSNPLTPLLRIILDNKPGDNLGKFAMHHIFPRVGCLAVAF